MEKISSVDQFNEVLQNEQEFFILKHSLTCPISTAAYKACQSFTNNQDVKFVYVPIQEARETSTHIAEAFNTRHESPQVFHVKNGEPVWNTSHSRITEKALKEASNR
ncbi:bacillithiol system redox-active protein YtxJ [Jeotgalibacillus haloalkalitolerans]|uniref:Bacillithiol system redox-active protein YtxJ n=1 Tax=Jeotgalibacillus haloalkalitolerans TaxID=3104292 RepID=A0ABU5KML8_9BACL|nr:bacillithiol system redox-active protein YtxJ [Jeotgalibacillus sp. HH7-29]MDZ5712505.1 bacillithiol system redox-active protein YtxJ [Jeotgalibacillus sp. HH7-29]